MPELAPSPSAGDPDGRSRRTSPPIEVSIDPEKVTAKPSRKLYLENAQVIAGVNTDQTFISNTILIFGDNLGDRRFIAIIAVAFELHELRLLATGTSRRTGSRRASSAFDQRTYYLGVDELGGQPTVERVQQAARYTGGSLIVDLPALPLLPHSRAASGTSPATWTTTI